MELMNLQKAITATIKSMEETGRARGECRCLHPFTKERMRDEDIAAGLQRKFGWVVPVSYIKHFRKEEIGPRRGRSNKHS